MKKQRKYGEKALFTVSDNALLLYISYSEEEKIIFECLFLLFIAAVG